jgi:hypothetical protein
MATMEMDAGTVERAFELLQGALTSKNSREALKICEDFEMEVLFPPCFPLSSAPVLGARNPMRGFEAQQQQACFVALVWPDVLMLREPG